MATAPAYQPPDYLGDVTAGLGIAAGLQRGGTYGDIAASASAARLLAHSGALGSESAAIGRGAGAAGEVLGIYGGIEQGGVAGYGAAGINAAELGAQTGAFGAASSEVGAVAGEAVIPLSVYNFAKNWRSGATGADVVSGAESGAAIGTAILPGIGTAIGLVGGAAVGAISSLFGPGREDPENVGWDQYASAYKTHGAAGVAGATPAQNFQMLSGIFDSRGSAIPFYNAFGRMGENQFMSAMAGKINQAYTKGQIKPTDTPESIYTKVVQPWITAMGGGHWQDTSTIQGAPEKQAVGNLLTSLIGQYTSGEITGQTPLGISGQTIHGLPAFAGAGHMANQNAVAAGGQFPIQIPGSTTPNPSASMLPLLLAAGGAAGAGMAGSPQFQMNDPTASGGIGAVSTDPTAIGAGGGGGGFNLSPLETTGLLEGIGILGAGYAQHQTQNTIAPLTNAAAPYIAGGQQLLANAAGSRLDPYAAGAFKTSQQQGAALIQAASPLGKIAQTEMQQYQSGNLKPADQAQLDQSVQAAKAQLIQSLGPNVDSSTLATYTAQIDQQAQITKQQMLNSYLATGNQEFDQWAQTTEAGQQTIQAGYASAVQQIDTTFSQAFQAGSLGGQLISDAVAQQIGSNNQLAGAFGNYTSNLAKAYALMNAAKGIGGGGGGGGAPGGASTPGLTESQTWQGVYDVNQGTQTDINAFNTNVMSDVNASMFANTPSDTLPSGTVSVGDTFGDYSSVGG